MAKEIQKIEIISRRVKSIGLNKKNNFSHRKEGKDLKDYFKKTSLAPVISVNTKGVANVRGRRYIFTDKMTFGIGQNINNLKINSFKDFPVIDPVEYIKKGEPYEAYPFVYDSLQNNERYRIKDDNSLDGVIEIFQIRKEHNITGIEISGVKASIAAGDFNKSMNSHVGTKGSNLIDNVDEINKSQNDFFEDSQDVLFANKSFPSVGNINSTNKIFSQEGYVSTGKYIISPYKEESIVKEEYDFMNETEKSILLKNSNRDMSELSTRFKTTGNGFIISQFQKANEQKRIGTDSIAFIGLLKG